MDRTAKPIISVSSGKQEEISFSSAMEEEAKKFRTAKPELPIKPLSSQDVRVKMHRVRIALHRAHLQNKAHQQEADRLKEEASLLQDELTRLQCQLIPIKIIEKKPRGRQKISSPELESLFASLSPEQLMKLAKELKS